MRKSLDYRRCPKCGGNLYMDRDWHGWYEQCLQCAFIRDLTAIPEDIKRERLQRAGQVKKRTVPV